MAPTTSANQIFTNLGKSAMETLPCLDKHSGKKTRAVQGCLKMACLVQGRPKKGETGEKQSQEHAQHFL
jgi:hypothetical protein